MSFKSTLLNAHEISIGRSPFATEHVTDTKSPQLAGSSPNVKGSICGATVNSIIYTQFPADSDYDEARKAHCYSYSFNYE